METITAEMIDVAEAIGACQKALAWLRAEPRQWREVPADWRRWLASNPAIAEFPALALMLARDPDVFVRWAPAANAVLGALPAVALVLARDRRREVRRGLAGNPALASLPGVVAVLANDPDVNVRRELAGNAALAAAAGAT